MAEGGTVLQGVEGGRCYGLAAGTARYLGEEFNEAASSMAFSSKELCIAAMGTVVVDLPASAAKTKLQ